MRRLPKTLFLVSLAFNSYSQSISPNSRGFLSCLVTYLIEAIADFAGSYLPWYDFPSCSISKYRGFRVSIYLENLAYTCRCRLPSWWVSWPTIPLTTISPLDSSIFGMISLGAGHWGYVKNTPFVWSRYLTILTIFCDSNINYSIAKCGVF